MEIVDDKEGSETVQGLNFLALLNIKKIEH